MSNAKAEEKKSKKSLWLILLLLLIIFALIGVIFFMKKDKDSNDDAGDKAVDRNVIVNENNAEDVAENLLNKESVPVGRYEVVMSTTWNFKDGSSASEDAYVANAERNTNAVYFDLVRSDTKEVILASPIIPVGSRMDKITLDSDLKKGTYDCVCTYHLINDEKKPIGKVSVAVTVNVQD